MGITPKVNRTAPPSTQNVMPRFVPPTITRETETREADTRSNVMYLPIITTAHRRANTTKYAENHSRITSGNTTRFMQLMRETAALRQTVDQSPPLARNLVKQMPTMMLHM